MYGNMNTTIDTVNWNCPLARFNRSVMGVSFSLNGMIRAMIWQAIYEKKE
jgi:hypothetical protein